MCADHAILWHKGTSSLTFPPMNSEQLPSLLSIPSPFLHRCEIRLGLFPRHAPMFLEPFDQGLADSLRHLA